MNNDDDLLLLSGLQHFSFCRRQWALIHIEQQWAENFRTTDGEIKHKNAHDPPVFERKARMGSRALHSGPASCPDDPR